MVKSITTNTAAMLTIAVALGFQISTWEQIEVRGIVRLSDREMKGILGTQGDLIFCNPIESCWGTNTSCPTTVPKGAKVGDNCGTSVTYYSLNQCSSENLDTPLCQGTQSQWVLVLCTRTYNCTVEMSMGQLKCLRSGQPTDDNVSFSASPDCWTAD